MERHGNFVSQTSIYENPFVCVMFFIESSMPSHVIHASITNRSFVSPCSQAASVYLESTRTRHSQIGHI